MANADNAPHSGWLREVYYYLGKLALADGEQVKAQDYLRRSGYKDFNRPITLYDQNVGYWRPDLQGLEHLTRADHAELMVDYLGVSERQLVKSGTIDRGRQVRARSLSA